MSALVLVLNRFSHISCRRESLSEALCPSIETLLSVDSRKGGPHTGWMAAVPATSIARSRYGRLGAAGSRILLGSAVFGHNPCVDRIDRAIVDQLRRDCRLTNTELADRVGLTPSPCLRRVQRLWEDGVILGYHARISPLALGRSFEVLVDIDLAGHALGTVSEFEDALVSLEEVVEARRMFSSPDYRVLVAVADLPAYEQLLTTRLLALPGVATLQSHFAMKTLKNDVFPV